MLVFNEYLIHRARITITPDKWVRIYDEEPTIYLTDNQDTIDSLKGQISVLKSENTKLEQDIVELEKSLVGAEIEVVSPIMAKHYLTSSYGYRIHPITKKRSFHYGIDLGTSYKNVGVYAIADGNIHVVKSMAKYPNGAGNRIYAKYNIEGKDYYALYWHLTDKFKVKNGQAIKKGDLLGYTGKTGNATGIHLHFGLMTGKTFNTKNYIDPTEFFKKYNITF